MNNNIGRGTSSSIMIYPEGMLYTSYFNNKKVENFKGVKMIVSRQLPLDKLDLISEAKQHFDLAPSSKLFSDIKSHRISFLQFKNRFRKELKEEYLTKITDILNRGHDVLILCYEKDKNRCHRQIIADKIKEQGYTVKEL